MSNINSEMDSPVGIVTITAALIITIYYWLIYPYQKLGPECSIPLYKVLDSGRPGPNIGIIGGVHGNEPAGSVALTEMLKTASPTAGKLTIIYEPNPCGLKMDMRENPYTWNDINRQFAPGGGMDDSSRRILEILEGCDLVLDFHEAWGFYLATKDNLFLPVSKGATLAPTTHEFWTTLAPKIVETLNKDIKEPLHKFAIRWKESCDISNTLGCYMATKGRPYLLVETAGQDDVLSLEVRRAQIETIIGMVMQHFTEN